ncbi:hypothetical protein VNO77_22632 [Canavalia gladiata]|uniref:Uncharacterized protein n=1 Tax=Canavalia gladiata TaxID=3824 RepID=A0AAN9L868_CANGL
MTLNPMLLFCLVAVIQNVVTLSNARQLKSIPDEKVVNGGENRDEVSKKKMAKKEENEEQNPLPFPFPFPFPYPFPYPQPQVPGLGGPITPIPEFPFPLNSPPFPTPAVPNWPPFPPFPPINIPPVPFLPVPSPPI